MGKEKRNKQLKRNRKFGKKRNRNELREQIEDSQTERISRNMSFLRLIELLPENNALVYPQLRLLLAGDTPKTEDITKSTPQEQLGEDKEEEIFPGINSCAVCGKRVCDINNEEDESSHSLSPSVVCEACGMIVYCSEEHKKKDFVIHQNVCYSLEIITSEQLDEQNIHSKVTEIISQYFQYDEDGMQSKKGSGCNKNNKNVYKDWSSFSSLLSQRCSGRKFDLYEDRIDRAITEVFSFPLTLSHYLHKFQQEKSLNWNKVLTFDFLLNYKNKTTNLQPQNNNNNTARDTTNNNTDDNTSNCKKSGNNIDDEYMNLPGKVFVVHVIGAAENECKEMKAWCEFAASFRNLGNITEQLSVVILFVGLQIPDEHHKALYSYSIPLSNYNDHDDNMCDNVHLLCWRGCYDLVELSSIRDNFIAFAPYISFPSVIIGYHMGLSVVEYDWKNTIEFIVSSFGNKVIVIVSSYTLEEARRDRKFLMDLGFNSIIGLELNHSNPFSSHKLKQSGTMANDVYFSNKYVAIYQYSEFFRHRQL